MFIKFFTYFSRSSYQVLHPIFEEDELTLILAGAALGFAAGLVQQGLETGTIKCPDILGMARTFWRNPRAESLKRVQALNRKLSSIATPFRRLACLVSALFRKEGKVDTDSDEV